MRKLADTFRITFSPEASAKIDWIYSWSMNDNLKIIIFMSEKLDFQARDGDNP